MTNSRLSTFGAPAIGPATMAVDGSCDLRVLDITKHYDGFSLQEVSLEVPRGSVVGLIGRNGAGKTTLMRAIMGALRLDGGRVELFGSDTTELSDAGLASLKQRIGFVSAVCAYPQSMTVADVAHMYQLAYQHFDRNRFDELARIMQLLPEASDRHVKDLSRGMGMKLQLCCALAAGVDLLVMDEPTAGLDPIVREEVLDVIRRWMEGETHSALISSHITSDLEHIADYLVMLEGGRVVLSCERDLISEEMGVAQLRAAELERVREAWPFGQTRMYVIDRGLYKSLLVPDRAEFAATFPGFVCDRATIDDVMNFIVKGEVS